VETIYFKRLGSLEWYIEYLEDFAGKEDVLRYVLFAAFAQKTKDSEIYLNDFQA